MVEANGGKMPEGSKNPPLRDWTQEASLLAQVIMELRQVTAVLIQANSKGKSQHKVQPVLTPETALSRMGKNARVERRLAVHDALVARLLGDRAKKGGT